MAQKSIYASMRDCPGYPGQSVQSNVTALDIQVSLCNQLANFSGLSSNMAACDVDIQVSLQSNVTALDLCNQMGLPWISRSVGAIKCDCPGYPGKSEQSMADLKVLGKSVGG